MARSLYPTPRQLKADGASDRFLRNVIAACAEGYGFPTNRDRDQRGGGIAPESQAELVWRSLQEDAEPDAVLRDLEAAAGRRLTDGQ
jgi:hypothetical protein